MRSVSRSFTGTTITEPDRNFFQTRGHTFRGLVTGILITEQDGSENSENVLTLARLRFPFRAILLFINRVLLFKVRKRARVSQCNQINSSTLFKASVARQIKDALD